MRNLVRFYDKIYTCRTYTNPLLSPISHARKVRCDAASLGAWECYGFENVVNEELMVLFRRTMHQLRRLPNRMPNPAAEAEEDICEKRCRRVR